MKILLDFVDFSQPLDHKLEEEITTRSRRNNIRRLLNPFSSFNPAFIGSAFPKNDSTTDRICLCPETRWKKEDFVKNPSTFAVGGWWSSKNWRRCRNTEFNKNKHCFFATFASIGKKNFFNPKVFYRS